jgi:hypothetical protein
VIEHWRMKELAGADHVLGELEIGLARRCMPGRVVVRQHDAGGVLANPAPEDLAGSRSGNVQRTQGDQVTPNDSSTGVEGNR